MRRHVAVALALIAGLAIMLAAAIWWADPIRRAGNCTELSAILDRSPTAKELDGINRKAAGMAGDAMARGAVLETLLCADVSNAAWQRSWNLARMEANPPPPTYLSESEVAEFRRQLEDTPAIDAP